MTFKLRIKKPSASFSRWVILLTAVLLALILVTSGMSFAWVPIPQSDAVTTVVPTVGGDGILCEIFLGVGGGTAPDPSHLNGRSPNADLLSPRIDFPHPGNTVAIGQSFQSFFSDTIFAPDAVRNLQPKNFILRGTALLKITQGLDTSPSTEGIDIVIRIGCDDGHYIKVGNQYLGNSPDHGFSWYSSELHFESEGLYPLYFLFAANSTGYSGLELQWMVGAGSWETIPQSYMYQSPQVCDRKIFFEEHPAGTSLSDQYASQGVIFNVLSGDLQITNAFPQDFVPVSGDRVFADPDPSPSEEGIVELLFVAPNTAMPALTHYFSCFVIDSEETGATLTAYDPDGDVLDTATVNAGGATQEQVEFAMAGIRRIEVSLGSGADTSALDNLCWAKPVALPWADLQVTEVTAPESAFSSHAITVTWTVKNFGNSMAGPPWDDTVYIADNANLDSYVSMVPFQRTESLDPNEGYTRSESITIPDGLNGDYWIIIRTDKTDAVEEYAYENNNMGVTDTPMNIVTDDTCLQVVSHTPAGLMKEPVSHVDISFKEAINGETFDTSDMILTDPEGGIIGTDTPVDMGDNVWRIGFDVQSAPGPYSLEIGPHIEDLAGNEMDQDNDGICGEEDTDVYKGVFQLSVGAEHSVLVVNVNGTYNTSGQHIYDTLVNAGADAQYFNLSAGSENDLVALLQDINNHFDQVWLFDLSAGADNYSSGWQAIADWFNEDPTRAIICDGRMISSYWSNRWQDEGQRLSENYYENMKINRGGLLLGTDHSGFQMGINTVNTLIGLEPFTGNFSLAYIPVDTASPLMTFPNDMGSQLFDDSSPGQTPYGLQPNGRILYSLAWHSANENTPGISSTIEGLVGFHVHIESPQANEHFFLGQSITFQASSTNATPPITYTWTSSIDGDMGTGETLEVSTLSVGTHIINLLGEDAGGGADTDTIAIILENLPDLVVSRISWDPNSDIEANTQVSLTASIENIGAIPVEDPFYCDLRIDGQSVGTKWIDQTMPSGESVLISAVWIATPGIHTVTAVADSTGTVSESNEGNNSRTETLPEVPDRIPPEDVTEIHVQSFEDRLVFTWAHSANTQGDLSGYRVYFDGAQVGIPLDATQNSYEATGLSPATAYPFKITAFDQKGNESEGMTLTGVTLIPNPQNVSVEPHSGYISLSWDAVSPSDLVKHYAVYASNADFSDVSGMQPKVHVSGTSANVAGLTNGVEYYIAVTAVNLSGGERKEVLSVSGTPIPDSQGPQITAVKWNDESLTQGHTLRRPGTFFVEASDAIGVSRVAFYIDGALLSEDRSGSPSYSSFFQIFSFEDGSHTLTIYVYDTLDNLTTVDYQVTIAPDPPSVPAINKPLSGLLTNKTVITLSGTGEMYSEVVVFNNGAELDAPVSVDDTGQFSRQISLEEGENRIQAAGQNRAGRSALSSEIVVTLDSSLPPAPTHLEAKSKAGGLIRLTWMMPEEEGIKGFNVYRATASFSSKDEAVKINSQLFVERAFEDLPSVDGTYFYRVTALDTADNESELSGETSAVSDSFMPRAVSIDYMPEGHYDPDTGRMGAGRVDVLLTVTESLQSTPYLTITPNGGSPISVELFKDNDLEYSGFFVISENTPSGTAYAVFSARDLVGNRGTEIDSGDTVEIGTQGPAVIRITLQPGDPIQNDSGNPVSVTVIIGLNGNVKEGEMPELSYLLSGEGRSEISVEGLSEVAPADGEAQAFQGQFILPADAGLTEPEYLQFLFFAVDALGNEGTSILCNNKFTVYQGNLPPLPIPTGLKGTSLPEGRVALSWNKVAGSVDYQIYRQAPGETEPTPYVRPGDVSEYVDEPSLDGSYTYGISSIRHENAQESLSPMSATIEVLSDATPPEAPENLSLELLGSGIKAEWDPPPYTEPVTYALYRADLPEITSVEGITPILTGIDQTEAMDYQPSHDEHAYVVTALDDAGNESIPSNSVYLNFDLLPVSSLSVLQMEDLPPVISWTHPGGDVEGFNVYLGEDMGVKLNEILITSLSFEDSGFAGDERFYSVTAVDSLSNETIRRDIFLPDLRATLLNGAQIEQFQGRITQILEYVPDFESRILNLFNPKRGFMNRLEYLVENHSQSRINNVILKARLDDTYDQRSEAFSIGPGEYGIIPVIVGGYEDLPDLVSLETIIDITRHSGDKTEIVRTGEIAVENGMLVMGIQTETLTHGLSGKVRFTLENTSTEEIEIVTATGSGGSDSPEITFYLLDEDENVLSSKAFYQADGEGLLLLSSGQIVARIAPGAIFRSEPLEIPVPAVAPQESIIRVSISRIHYHIGEPDHVAIQGISTTQPVSLIDTSYYGEVLSISPQSSSGGEDITITGRAVSRANNQPLPNVPLHLVIAVNGFERSYEVNTDETGQFDFAFIPLPGESGIYNVYLVHPGLKERQVQGQFVITRVMAGPETIDVSIPKNYEETISIQVRAGMGTELNNVRLVYEALDQPEGVFPTGVHVSLGNPIERIGSGQMISLPFTIWADNTARPLEKLVFRVKSDESGEGDWATIVVNTHFTEATPHLSFSPSYVETGVALEESEIETIVLQNNGLADLNDLVFELLSEDGSSPAPDWVYLNSKSAHDAIAVGESLPVSISFSPGPSVTEGYHTFYLQVSSSNHPTTNIGLYAAVTQSGVGNVLFKISNIYTGTLNENNEVVQGLADAKIYVQNDRVIGVEETLNTDAFGEALFTDLPSGSYKCRITAPNHQEYIGRFWIKPGITMNQEVFLEYDLVTVEWEVVPTTIEDKYEIVLSATFKTDVPAAVVVTDPPSVNLPEMKAGDVYYDEFDVINYGLIQAENVQFALPVGDAFFKVELLAGLPNKILPKERWTIPYRVTCLKSPGLEDEGGGTGGGCQRYFICERIIYEMVCSNGKRWTRSTIHCYYYSVGDCGGKRVSKTGATSGLTGGWTIVDGGGGWGPSGWGRGGRGTRGQGKWIIEPPGPKPKPVKGVICWPERIRTEELFRINLTPIIETFKKILFYVGCKVNTVFRELNDDVIDLSVKVPGGKISVQRWFYGDQWHWEHFRKNLSFLYYRDEIGFAKVHVRKKAPIASMITLIKSIRKGGVEYRRTSENTFSHDTYTIQKMESHFMWRDKFGNWEKYDLDGRFIEYGTRLGTLGKLLYAGGRLTGIADRNNRQIIWFEYNQNGQLSAVRDTEDRRVEYTYQGGRLTKVKNILGLEALYEYNAKGQITKLVDEGGRPTFVSYDSYGNVSKVVDRNGKGHLFEYSYDDARKEMYARITYPSGKVEEVWYDQEGHTKRIDVNGRKIQEIIKDGRNLIIVDEKGNITQKKFDEWQNVTQIIYPDGSTASFEYEHRFNQLTQVKDVRGFITEYRYDNQGNLIKKTEALGTDSQRVINCTYDAHGQILTVTLAADANTESAQIIISYDDNGNLASLTDPMGNTTEFLEYDNMGNLLNLKDPRGYNWRFAYDGIGRLISQTDPLNHTTIYEYDGANNRTAIINANLKRFGFEYDDHNNLIKAIDPSEKYTVTRYDMNNLPIRTIDQEDKQALSEYDNEGRLVKSTDGAGNQTIYYYDESQTTNAYSDMPIRIDYPTYSRRLYYDKLQRVIRETIILDDHTSYSASFSYDATGNIISETDREGNTTWYEYDALNRLIKTIDSMGGITQCTYDNRGNLISLEDPEGGITSYEYDRNNSLVKQTRPTGEQVAYEYDSVGNRIAIFDTKGQKVSYQYDALNRLIIVQYFAVENHENPIKTVDFTYDKMGNLISYDDGTTSATYTHDDLERKISESVNYGPFTLSYSYTYYANDLKKSFTGPNGIPINYRYDKNNRLTGIAIQGQGEISYNTYQWNSPTKMTLPGGTTAEYAYDPLMQLKSISVRDPGRNQLMNYTYEYSATGNIKEKNTEHGQYTYEYDQLYRLISATNPVTANEVYTYDAIGNRLTSAGVDGTWSYNESSHLLGFDDVSFEYNENGSMIRKSLGGQVIHYIYNVENRLVRVEDGNGNMIAEYYYDPFGRRLWKEIDGVKTYFLYADEGLVGEYDANGQEIRTYGYEPDSIWTTDPFFQSYGGMYYWYQNDHQGIPQKIIDTSGRVVWSATYDSFGNVLITISEIENNLRLPGQYYDAETGLYYNWNRYYDPVIGRYLSPDPIEQGLNLYAYVFGNPVNLADPEGLCVLRIAWGIVEIVGGVLMIPASCFTGTAAGVFLIINGLDNVIAGGRSLIAGEYKQSFIEAGIHSLVPNSIVADVLYTGLQCLTGNVAGASIRTGGRGVTIAGRGVCFAAGTLVETDQGLMPIEKVMVGDFVLSRNEKTDEMTWCKVSQVFVTPNQMVFELGFVDEKGNEETLGVTGEHPFWVRNRGWVAAVDLLPGDEIFTSRGGWARVGSGTWISQTQTVYNLEVDNFHTYFVGESSLWVHNACGTALVKSDNLPFNVSLGRHAQLERMAQRGVTKQMIDATLRKGRMFWDPKNKTVQFVLNPTSGKNIGVAINPVTKKVTTVMRQTKSVVRPRFTPIPRDIARQMLR